MTIELWTLLASAGVLLAGLVAQGIAGLVAYGPVTQAGPRDGPRESNVMMGRTTRAAQNQIESLALFAPVVLVLQLTGANSELSAMGAMLHLASRVIYMPVYWLGIPFIRTIIFTAGLAGIAMVATPVLTS